MAGHEPFSFRTGAELISRCHELKLRLPYQEELSPLLRSLDVGKCTAPNRMAVQPMEGFDGEVDGSPGTLTIRRYGRYAAGGSGLIWFEATSITRNGRSNPRQLWLHENNVDAFSRLVESVRRQALEEMDHEPVLVLQLTHSGRYSRPDGKPEPVGICRNSILEKSRPAPRILTDDELLLLQDRMVKVAGLAAAAGFDFVDVKACHGYLFHEFLWAYQRTDSRYGGSLENRLRFLVETMERIRSDVPRVELAARLNVYDGLPRPDGFGAAADGSSELDLDEPLQMIRLFRENKLALLNVTMGIPVQNSYLGRPHDRSLPGAPVPPEHPLQGVARILEGASEVQRQLPDLPVMGTGYSWLRQFWPQVGAAMVEQREVGLVGLGRGSFAYPDAPRDLLREGVLVPGKVCVACSGCTELMRAGRVTGCIVRDRAVYGPEIKAAREGIEL